MQTSSGSVSFGDRARLAGSNEFENPEWTAYNFSNLRQYKHGESLLDIGDKIVGGGRSSEKMSHANAEIGLIVNDADYSNNAGEFSVRNQTFRLSPLQISFLSKVRWKAVWQQFRQRTV